MKKVVKDILLILLIFSVAIVFSFDSAWAKEKTLSELREEAQANRDAYNKAKEQKALSQQEKEEATIQKAEVQKQITETQNEIIKITEEISSLQDEISKKDKQIKNLMSFVQISNGEISYLEYAFGATSFTDFIYRISVAEQLSDYNDQLIEEYNKSVEELDTKKNELTSKQEQLNKKEQELVELEAKLEKEIEKTEDEMLSKDEEYKTQITLINNLIKLGCKESETKTSCQNRLAASMSGSSSGSISSEGHTGVGSGVTYYLPLAVGHVSSPYGYRSSGFHSGIDFSNRAVSNVYPVAPGIVVAYIDGSTGTCGNHIIYVYHPSNNYTTSYWHLTNRKVSLGDEVSVSTVLGVTGDSSYVDPCAQGGHVHLNLFNGLSVSNSGRIDPGNFVKNIPAKDVDFTSPR